MACHRCGRDHSPVSLAEWLWRLRDTKPKPPGKQLGVLVMLASRLDARTGCGWVYREQTAEDAGASPDTVSRAGQWAVDRLLLAQVVRGHRITDEHVSASLWHLLPTTQSRSGAALGHDPKPQNGEAKAANSTTQSRSGAAL